VLATPGAFVKDGTDGEKLAVTLGEIGTSFSANAQSTDIHGDLRVDFALSLFSMSFCVSISQADAIWGYSQMEMDAQSLIISLCFQHSKFVLLPANCVAPCKTVLSILAVEPPKVYSRATTRNSWATQFLPVS